MANLEWTARFLQRALGPLSSGHGKSSAIEIVSLAEFELFQVIYRRGRADEAMSAVETLVGMRSPTSPAIIHAGAADLIWSAPDQIFVLRPKQGDDFRWRLRQAVGNLASISEQSDGRCLLRMSGPRARDALAKMVSIDLHDRVFPVGAAAATSIDHTAGNIWRLANNSAGSPVYHILVFSSFAESLWDAFVEASVEFGVKLGSAPFVDAATT